MVLAYNGSTLPNTKHFGRQPQLVSASLKGGQQLILKQIPLLPALTLELSSTLPDVSTLPTLVMLVI